MKAFLRNQGPLVIWLVIIFWLSSIRHVPRQPWIPHLDKIVHATIFLVLCWFAHRAFRFQDRMPGLRQHALIAAFLLTVAYGYIDEFHQRFVPGRSYDLADFAADSTGALIYVGLYRVIAERQPQPPGAR